MRYPLLATQIFSIIILLNRILLVQLECNVCNAGTSTACISQTEFQQCNNNNKPFGNIYKCNKENYCSILGNCTPLAELSDCKLCEKCDDSKTFACTGTQSFALCLGKDAPSEITAHCTGNLTCNTNNPRICGDGTPTCSFRDDDTTTAIPTTTTTTTQSPAQDPNAFCQRYQKVGRYPVGTNPQTTCRQFISCVQVATKWYGPIYNCPGQTYFDSSKNGCVTETPITCGGTVAGLSFQNILLE